MIIHQWLQAAHRHDAVGDNARLLRDLLRAQGHESDIFALTIDDDLESEILPWHDSRARQGDATMLHFTLPSPMTEAMRTLPGLRLLQYHNVTPPAFFAPFDTAACRLTILARRELAALADRVDLALGVSEFNREELDGAGFRNTDVLPVAVNTNRLTGATPVPSLAKILSDENFVNILFVGRIAPNKRIEDHIRLAEQYKRYIDAHYRFIFVGRYDAVPHYYEAMRALILEYQMLADRFWFTGAVTDDELAAFYQHAHAYVSLSEHEGFCAPLVEAMAMDVPILAYGAGAVPETLGGAGVCFTPKDLEYAAEWLGRLIYDQPLRDDVLAGQRRRAADFGLDRVDARLREIVAAL